MAQEDSNHCVQEALGNPLIMNQIFKHLDSKFLLSSCSFVNKIWCKEASSFIQNYRECKVHQRRGSRMCDFLRDVDHLLDPTADIRKLRRIPYNGMQIRISHSNSVRNNGHPVECYDNNKLLWGNLKNHFNLKFLDVGAGLFNQDCPVHHPLRKLLLHKAGQVKHLIVKGSLKLFCRTCEQQNNDEDDEWDWRIFLPQLELLDISFMSTVRDDDEKPGGEKLLNAAPKLNKIVAAYPWQLRMFPVDKLPSLLDILEEDVKLTMDRIEDMNLLNTISNKVSWRIKKLLIRVPPFDGQFEEEYFDFPEDEYIVNVEERRSFDQRCGCLLQICHSSLQEITIHGVLPLSKFLCLPPLKNLFKFKVVRRFDGELDELWDSIGSIDYERMMPGLKEVEISIKTCFSSYLHGFYRANVDSGSVVYWPPKEKNNDIVYSSSSTVRKLTLNVQVPCINLRPLKDVFPNVTTLRFQVPYTDKLKCDIAPLAQVWEHFPQLEELEIVGDGGKIYRNYDGDFCGLSGEQAEFLGKQSEEYLRTVEVKPVGPSILNMSNLRKLLIKFSPTDFHSWKRFAAEENQVYFISKVTRLLAFERMPGLEVDIPSFMERH